MTGFEHFLESQGYVPFTTMTKKVSSYKEGYHYLSTMHNLDNRYVKDLNLLAKLRAGKMPSEEEYRTHIILVGMGFVGIGPHVTFPWMKINGEPLVQPIHIQRMMSMPNEQILESLYGNGLKLTNTNIFTIEN